MADASLPISRTPQGDAFLSAQTLQGEMSRYDTFTITGNGALVLPNPINFFQVPLGRAGSGFAVAKTLAQTNMAQGGALEYPVTGTIYRIMVSIMLTTAIDANNLFNNYLAAAWQDSILQIEVNNAIELQKHLVWFGGTGLGGSPLATAAAAPDGYVEANPSIMGRKDLTLPITLPSRAQFVARIIPNATQTILTGVIPTATYTFRVALEGMFSRVIDQ